MKNLTLAKQKGDQKPSNPSITVNKGMNRLELSVCQSAVDEDREGIDVLEKVF